jgi:FSR family fosmidomycin resistance protein-like MFS transporter
MIGAEGEFQAGEVLTIVGGHFVHDMFAAFLAPLQPLLIEKVALSFTQAGSLVSVIALPALLNPFIGYLADRVNLRYFVILAPAITATFMASMGLAPSYLALALMLLVTGVSSAAFHAPATAMAGRASGRQVGKGMSWFMAGGELGRTIGPLLAVWAAATWAFEGSFRLAVVGWATSAVLYWRLRQVPGRPQEQRKRLRAVLPAFGRLFLPLLVITCFRGLLSVALTAYLPIFMAGEGASLLVAGASLAILELAGVGGALVGGALSDRLGHKLVMSIGLASSSLLMWVFLRVEGWLLLPVLLALGFTMLSVSPVLMALVQEHFPENRAVASSSYVAMSVLVRSLNVLIVGAAGDMFGLRSAFLLTAFAPLVAVLAVLWLPNLERAA